MENNFDGCQNLFWRNISKGIANVGAHKNRE
jgi:hypothetical protein